MSLIVLIKLIQKCCLILQKKIFVLKTSITHLQSSSQYSWKLNPQRLRRHSSSGWLNWSSKKTGKQISSLPRGRFLRLELAACYVTSRYDIGCYETDVLTPNQSWKITVGSIIVFTQYDNRWKLFVMWLWAMAQEYCINYIVLYKSSVL